LFIRICLFALLFDFLIFKTKKMKKNNFIIAVLLGITFASCQKGDTGPTGSAGTNGSNGTNGSSGTNGTNGTNGVNGNANVQSIRFNVGTSGWTNYGTFGINNVSVPQITQAIIDSGLIISYWVFYNSTFSDTVDLELPFTDGNVSKAYYPYFSLGHYGLEIDNFGHPFITPTTPYNIRLVLATAHARHANPNLDWNNYEAVKQRFNLGE
jgi:hypothetical protein